MGLFRVDVRTRNEMGSPTVDPQLVALLRDGGLSQLRTVAASRYFSIEGDVTLPVVEQVAANLLTDPITEQFAISTVESPRLVTPAGSVACEVEYLPGVMDPVAESTRAELLAEGHAIVAVRTGRRYVLEGDLDPAAVRETVRRVLANDCIERVIMGTAGVQPSPTPPAHKFEVRYVELRHLDDAQLERLSREAHLFLSRAEMRAIRAHFVALGRDPTDVELETLAQTWSEHCVHKTLRSPIRYRGAALPRPDGSSPGGNEERRYGNLLRDTIVRATEELMASRRGPRCWSVFKDNAGVIAFDDDYGIAFKVETHNHPSAIEPYGGAATGVGGVIRDVIGCGLGAKPVANTDIFCVAPSDWPMTRLPKGVLHPRRVLRGVVRGVADYGNRMGIPTVNGAVYFDPRYLGNPLVFCGCVGLLPRDRIEKAAQPGDLVVVIGGRTGRDGIHGATFSSAELTDTHADEFSHAVQIGNAITEKRILDAVLAARDADGGCLYSAITDCGAGGLSSAVGEMGEHVGAAIDLEKVPLKYAGLRYDEIWISEAQERMVVAVPPANIERFLAVMVAEEVEATVIGHFGEYGAEPGDTSPRVVLRYDGHTVGELDMQFLHGGVPRAERLAEWDAPQGEAGGTAPRAAEALSPTTFARLPHELARPSVASKEWIIRQYDHEVQGGSAGKPLLGPGLGPGDAAVLRPRLASRKALALGCGLAPHIADLDPYWMAAASIDEAVRNVVCVGADPRRTALLDNFCWGRTDDARQLGALVRACQACYDGALAYGTPFISGKDSLNNEFALDPADVESLVATLHELAAGQTRDAERLRAILPELAARLRERQRLAIPSTLLISAVGLLDDVERVVSPVLRGPGHELLLVGGLPQSGYSLPAAAAIHQAVADLIGQRLVLACHDVSDGGWLVALAEMVIASANGARLRTAAEPLVAPYEECCATYVIEVTENSAARHALDERGIAWSRIATVTEDPALVLDETRFDRTTLRRAWSRGE